MVWRWVCGGRRKREREGVREGEVEVEAEKGASRPRARGRPRTGSARHRRAHRRWPGVPRARASFGAGPGARRAQVTPQSRLRKIFLGGKRAKKLTTRAPIAFFMIMAIFARGVGLGERGFWSEGLSRGVCEESEEEGRGEGLRRRGEDEFSRPPPPKKIQSISLVPRVHPNHRPRRQRPGKKHGY